jgi:hypothetical protein
MWILVIVLVAAWFILSIIGFAVEGLFWLGLIGIILLVATAIIGWLRHSALRK